MFSYIISLVPSIFFLLEGHQSFIYLLLCMYIIFSIMIFSLPFLLHFVIIWSWPSKLLTLFSAKTILLAASQIVLGETAVSSLEAGSYFPDQELDLGILDENQESLLLVHQGIEGKSKVALTLALFWKHECFKEAKTVETGTNFIFRDIAHRVGEHTEKQFI